MATVTACAVCGEELLAGAAFCEACGAAAGPAAVPATPDPACHACGAAVGADGYCTDCGMLAPRPRDHVELDASGPGVSAAAVSDRGLRHHRNEDAVWLVAADGPWAGVAVADGVSTSVDADAAATAAVEAAGAVLAAGTGTPDGDDATDDAAAEVLVRRAVQEAATTVAALAGTGTGAHAGRRPGANPSCTLVVALVRAARIDVGWLGDSRAYWVPATGPAVSLTVDDSWATEAIRLGADPEQVWASSRAHAITAWLGADAEPTEPHTGGYRPDAAGWLVVCSDGLWNYLTDPDRFADTVREHALATVADEHPALALARRLTGYAVAAGGHDNITVAVVQIPTPRSGS